MTSTTNRFSFGKNWSKFVSLVDDTRIATAEDSLRSMLDMTDLSGKTFIDIGSGSGLFSLAARRLGAKVHSFDYDKDSVECTLLLKQKYFEDDSDWTIEHGDVLNHNYMSGLGRFDIVYSWGVLHHTGAMWLAIENVLNLVCSKECKVNLALYNDQGWKSHGWWLIKALYNALPSGLRVSYAIVIGVAAKLFVLFKYTLLFRPMTVIRTWKNYKKNRGMSIFHDMIDWVGGFPFEFVGYDLFVRFMEAKGYKLLKGNKAGSLGCHEFSFHKTDT